MTPNDDANTGPAVVHPRLSVVWVHEADRADVARMSGRGDLITQDDVVASARTLAAERGGARGAALGRLERDLKVALQSRDVTAAERDQAERRLAWLNEAVAWSVKALDRLPELGEAVRRASTEAGLREAEHQAASAKLDNVIEQRAEAAVATDAGRRASCKASTARGSTRRHCDVRSSLPTASRKSRPLLARGRSSHRGARSASRHPGP